MIVSKEIGEGQLVFHCSAAALSPSLQCLGKGGGVCGVYGVCAVSGRCLRDPVSCQGVLESKQVG